MGQGHQNFTLTQLPTHLQPNGEAITEARQIATKSPEFSWSITGKKDYQAQPIYLSGRQAYVQTNIHPTGLKSGRADHSEYFAPSRTFKHRGLGLLP